jgi:hypothetical protein
MHSDRGSQFTSEAYNQVTANMRTIALKVVTLRNKK